MNKQKRALMISISVCTIIMLTLTIYIFSNKGMPIDESNKSSSIDNKSYKDMYKEFKSYKSEVKLNVPFIKQYPELPRGCEVTALAMLLNYQGVNVNKTKLANEIKKDPTPKKIKNGKINFGNPNIGYVGNMFSLQYPGYGVYIGPIEQLSKKYFPNKTINLTGKSFDEIKFFVSNGHPVWIITNTTFKRLPSYEFETWYTKQGRINITYKEHSVIITGYDNNFVYMNNPLDNKPNTKAPIQDFIDAWVQLGGQALTITNN